MRTDTLFTTVEKLIKSGCFKDAITRVFDFVRNANKFFDAEQPWITHNTNKAACGNTLYQCVAGGYLLPEFEILFRRIDKKVIEEETEKLKAVN